MSEKEMTINELLLKFIAKVQASERLTLALIRASGKKEMVIQALNKHLSAAEKAKSPEQESLKEYLDWLSAEDTSTPSQGLSLVPPILEDDER